MSDEILIQEIAVALADAYDEGLKESADTIETLRAENARLQKDLHEYVMQAESGNQKQVAEMCELRKENARLREALKPFARLQKLEWKGTMFENRRDDDAVFYHHATGTSLTLGDFRAARAAIGEEGESNG